MPLQAYECQDCETGFEKLVTSANTGRVQCPSCESVKVVRTLSMPAKPVTTPAATNCRGDGPPCGRTGCGRLAQR